MIARLRRFPDRAYGVAGVLELVAILGALYVSYTAERGLPFADRYRVTVDVLDARRVARNAEVRVAGVRVGRVERVTAVAGRGARPRARISLSLGGEMRPLSTDSTVKIRPASVLGAVYVELIPGRGRRTLDDGAHLVTRPGRPSVELTDLLDVFDPATATDLRRALTDTGDALVGRGEELNLAIPALRRLLGPAQRLARLLAADDTRLVAAIRGFAETTRTLAAHDGRVGSMVTGAARTLEALVRADDALDATLRLLPTTARDATKALRALRPALADLAAISVALRPAAGRLPRVASTLDATLRSGIHQAPRITDLARRTDRALGTLGTVARRPSTDGAIRKLTELIDAAQPGLRTVHDAQLQCNVFGMFFYNFGTAGSWTTDGAPPYANIFLTDLGTVSEMFQAATPTDGIRINPLPHTDRQECEAGNEPWSAGTLLGNPPGRQPRATRATAPPVHVRPLAQKAGLVDPPDGTP
ncbi:MAG: MlaD family protein [Solirubrobacteraceae bacterium]